MGSKLKNASRITLHVFVALALLAGCAFRPKVRSEVSPEISKYNVKTVVILPFEALMTPQVTEGRPYDEVTAPQGAVRSDISLAVPPSGERQAKQEAGVPASAADKVTRSFFGKLSTWEGLRVHAPDDASAALKAVAAEGRELAPEERAAKVATRMSVDAAVTGRVLVYQERKGSKLGGETAAVGFEVKLVSADGTLLWTGNYYEKQKPLTEDAKGSIERGFMFVTADELVEYGTTRLADQFPFGAKAKR
jgi:hypothetical protein